MLLGLAAFAVSLLAYMPAQFAVRQAGVAVDPARVSGTIWQGKARLDDTHSVDWETSPLQSLRRMAVVVNWRIIGPGTDLTGRVAVPLPPRADRAEIDAVTGNVAWSLVAAAIPDLAIACTARADVSGLRLSLAPNRRSAEGSITTQPGLCNRLDGSLPPVPAPALRADLFTGDDGLKAVLTAADAPQTPLATARLTTLDQLILTVHAAGAALVPGMPSSADSEIEVPLSALLP